MTAWSQQVRHNREDTQNIMTAELRYDPGAEAGNRDEPDFPEGFQGAGPMYAAIPLGARWLEAASDSVTTYILESPYGCDPELTDEQAYAERQAYTGWSAFADRDQAEVAADARHGTFIRWEGLTGEIDWTAKTDAERKPAEVGLSAFLDEPEWDDADSAAYQDRVEAGLEMEAGS